MKVYFLGTNGWYDTKTGNTVCVLTETKNEYVIFDAGNGLYKIDRYIKRGKPVYLFLSHYHFDHVIGLHILSKFRFEQGVDIFGPPGLKLFFKKIINNPYTVPLSGLLMKIRLHEITRGVVLPKGISHMPLEHSATCYGYRFCSEGKTIAYCTDTGVCNNLYLLAKNADLFISECSLKPGQNNRSWPHLNSEEAARAALRAGAKRLALIHFDASLYLNPGQRTEAAKVSKKIFRNSFACKDDMKLGL